MKGKLYGIGVGPGDPELITLKAKRILNSADYIAVPKTAMEKESLALKIAAGVLDSKKEILELLFPMSFDSKVLEDSWTKVVESVKKKLDDGKTVAFVTLGDPTVYSTYMYIHKEFAKMGYETEIIPGVTSFCASAARAGISLGENKEAIAIVPSAYECDELDNILESFDSVVLMKVAKKFGYLRDKLISSGLANNTVLVSKCSQEDEMIEFDIEKVDESKLSYFTTMIIKKGKE